MKLTFLGAAHEVTGSCSLLEACGKNILIDCGMEQGADIYENCDLPISPANIDAICLTHAHIDHSGLVPAMVAQGYKGPVYVTQATGRLCNIMLRDSAYIQEHEAEWRNRKAKRNGTPPYVPIYTVNDAEQALSQFETFGYNETVDIFDGIQIFFSDAGHLLGSSSIHIKVIENGETRTLLFSGDLGNVSRPLIRDPQSPPDADYVIIESTYGDRLHGARPDYEVQLSAIMQDTFDRGGNLVIPSFAIGRTQELLYLIRNIKEKQLIKGHDNFLVYVDSPLAVEATKIYSDGLTDYYDKETLELLDKGIDPINFEGLKLSITSAESKAINFNTTPKVIISASGMCEAGRIRHHLKHNLWMDSSTILFVGYQSEGTVGRKLVDGAKSVHLFGEEIQVNAKIASLVGISGHADRDMLLNWLGAMKQKPRKVFVNHGDDTVCDDFAQTISDRLYINAVAPYSGDEFDLLTGTCTGKGTVKKVSKLSNGRRRANTLYNRLLEAHKRLRVVIDSNRDIPNRDVEKLIEQINSLCEEYARELNDKK
ncbi:MAG: MBL fold metallo-hydrolase [Ruminococcaceae bacterium]|nr:MBL fold metallo-hydrolase [Oscillospiraceae bacterium]